MGSRWRDTFYTREFPQKKKALPRLVLALKSVCGISPHSVQLGSGARSLWFYCLEKVSISLREFWVVFAEFFGEDCSSSFGGSVFSPRFDISGRLCFQDIQAHSSTLNSTKSCLHFRPQECRVTAESAFDLMTEEFLARLSSEHRSLSTPCDNVFSSCTCCEGLNCSLHQVFDTNANLVRFQHSTEQRSRPWKYS